VGTAGHRWYSPIDGTRNSYAEGQADRSSWDHRNWRWPKSLSDSPAFINAFALNGRMRFVAVTFVPIIGE